MGKKFKTNIDLAVTVEPGEPEQGDVRLSMDALDSIVITRTDGTCKHVLDSDALPLDIAMGGTGLSELGSPGQVLTVSQGGDSTQWRDSSPETPASIKSKYESNPDTNAYTDADLAAVENIPTALSQLTNDSYYVADQYYTHTDNNFTAEEKNKLAGLDDNHFKGNYLSLEELQDAHPSAQDGDYAYVGAAGTTTVMYIWDGTDEQWEAGSSPAGETPASIKSKYESNQDTNAYTDDDLAVVGTVGDVTDLETSNKSTVVGAINELAGDIAAAMDNPMAADGDIIIGGADGAPARLPIGTAGQVLTVNSGASAPVWQNGGGGGGGNYVKLASVTVTANTYYVTFESIFDPATYSSYVVYFSRLMLLTNDGLLCLQLKNGTGVYAGASDYVTSHAAAYGTSYTAAQVTDKWMALTKIGIAAPGDVSGASGISGELFIGGADTDASKTQVVGTANGYSVAGSNATLFNFAGSLNVAYPVDGFRLLFSSGRTTSGNVTVFGVKR
jgi:hypothetical protein